MRPSETAMSHALAGRGILVTRPLGQAEGLAARVAEAAGRPIVFPALAILDPTDTGKLQAVLQRLDAYDDAIFISPTAVQRALDLLAARGELPTLPARLRVAAIGQGTARALAVRGIAPVIVPAGPADSEALLALPQFAALAGRAIVIFRGEGGRALLATTLAARGAQVEYAECYRRACPDADVRPLIAAWSRGEIDAVTLTSVEALRNLDALLAAGGRALLRATPLFVPHARIAAAARAMGVERVIVTAPGDEGLIAAMAEYYASAPQQAGATAHG